MPIVEKPSTIEEYIHYLNRIADKWRKVWEANRLYESNPSNKPKFFLTAAFPYPNGLMHLGHARTYTLTDIYARFKRLKGYNVLFPMGFHYTGTPILAMADSVKEGDPKTLKLFKEVYNIPDDVIEKMKDPMFMVKYFHEKIRDAMKVLGYSIDWRREFTSIDPLFSKFIHWQFSKLYEKGYIVKGTHPVGWDPVVGTPVSMHDTKGDVEPEIGEFTLIFFTTEDGVVLPAATLRPETVFGAVNVWVNPSAVYVEAIVDGKKWILSKEAAEKLVHQLKKVSIVREIRGEELIGLRVRNPATGWRVPVLPAKFVDPDTGTGIVMSVPAHAPYDYIALKEIIEKEKDLLDKLGIDIEELKPKSVIEVPGVSKFLAIDVVEKKGIKSQLEKDALDEATKEVYSIEFKQGVIVQEVADRVLTDIIDDNARNYVKAAIKALIVGKPVSEARDLIAEWLRESGYADKMYEIMNKPVYSRWGNKVIVKVLENQWFIDYGIEDWKKLAREALSKMNIVPEASRREFKESIEWVKKRACARTRGLGTKLPWDPDWVIESLSDSTIYMAFYTIVHILRKYGVEASKLTNKVWDYIFLGKGNPKSISRDTGIPLRVLVEARREFDYWYPLDSRHSGKDLIKNHLTFFIYNHVAIFPREKWPRQIVVNGYVLYRGSKMSKSLFNVIPVQKLAQQLSPDGLRLAIALSSEIDQDLDFREETVLTVLEQLRRIESIVNEHIDVVREYRGKTIPDELSLEDLWVLSKSKELFEEAEKALEKVRIRYAANIIYYVYEEVIKKYIDILKTKGRYLDEVAKTILAHILSSWIKAMAPYTPFIAEELWNRVAGEGFVVNSSWPVVEDKYYSPEALLAFEYISRLISDGREIIRVRKKEPVKVKIYVVKQHEYSMLHKALKYINETKSMKDYIRDVISSMTGDKKKIAQKARQVFELASSLSPYIKELIREKSIDEKSVIDSMKEWIEKQIGAPIEVYYAEETVMPVGKTSIPFKPAIYIEFKE